MNKTTQSHHNPKNPKNYHQKRRRAGGDCQKCNGTGYNIKTNKICEFCNGLGFVDDDGD